MIRLPENRIISHPKNKNKLDIPTTVLGHCEILENKMFALKCFLFYKLLSKK